MTDRENVIKELKKLHGSKETMELIVKTIELLKEQEEEKDTIQKIGADYGLTIEGVRHAIEAYHEIVSEITGGSWSKLTYDASFVIEKAEEHYRRKYGQDEEKHPCERCQEYECDGCPYSDDER